MDPGNLEPRSAEDPKALRWAELIGLIRFRPNGSWDATALARKLIREQRSGLDPSSPPDCDDLRPNGLRR